MDTFENIPTGNDPLPETDPEATQIPETSEPLQDDISAEIPAQDPVPTPQPPQPPVTPPPTPQPFPPAPGYAQPWNQPQARSYTGTFPPPAQKKPRQKKGSAGKTVLCGLLTLALVAAGCGITAMLINDHWKERTELMTMSFNEKLQALEAQLKERPNHASGDSVSGTPNNGTEGGMTPAQVYAQNVASVVAIECRTSDAISSGSGFVLTEDGYIASNHHVVEDATRLTVTFSDGTEYDAEYVGGDEANDISLLKIEATGLRPVTVGRSDDLIVGDQVAAIGNPLGELASTLTVGYVSAKDRVITTDGSQINMLQTDAAINPGNSGGPLFNMMGQVIGITTAKYSGTTSSGASIEGIGFAIPIDDVIDMLEDLRQFGYITGAYLGVSVSNVDENATKLYGLPLGVLVQKVDPGACADEGGIRPQDIIVDLGGYKISNLNDLTRALRRFKAGDEISVTVYRHSQGGETVLKLVLDEKPRATEPETTEPTYQAPMFPMDPWFDDFFG